MLERASKDKKKLLLNADALQRLNPITPFVYSPKTPYPYLKRESIIRFMPTLTASEL